MKKNYTRKIMWDQKHNAKLLREWKNKLQTGRKYLQNTCVLKDCSSQNAKNSQVSIRKQSSKIKTIKQKKFPKNKLTKKYTQIENKYKKSYSKSHQSLDACKLIAHWHTTAYLLECPKKKNLMILNAGKDGDQLELSCIAGGIKNGTVSSETGFLVYFKC